ncbi:phospholysine phosphohistidine inorganic pyrophosphate phosphatase [Camelus ferus]|nr:phospholysine phosphohistidine inorganic pyrophosphate phosphatase [Camelus ferus]
MSKSKKLLLGEPRGQQAVELCQGQSGCPVIVLALYLLRNDNERVSIIFGLKRSPLKVRFCTNESQKSRGDLVGLLRRLGFDISEGEVTAPAPATCLILKERGLRPHLLVHDGVRSEFDQIDTSNPNCVVIADAGESFSYHNMNKAFQVLMELENPVLLSLGKGRYYKETSGLLLDVGPYMKALEFPRQGSDGAPALTCARSAAPARAPAQVSLYHRPSSLLHRLLPMCTQYACGIEAEVVGKPSPEFFKSALQEMGVEAHQAIMIGDDIVGDVGGAQRCGMRALQVRTGKYRWHSRRTEAAKAPCMVLSADEWQAWSQ